MRGYFGIGVEGISKASNLGAITRTAHAFDASFTFTVSEAIHIREVESVDTSSSMKSVPFYRKRIETQTFGCLPVRVEFQWNILSQMPLGYTPPNSAVSSTPRRRTHCRHLLR